MKTTYGRAKVQVTGHRSGQGYRPQATGQVTGYRPQVRSQVRLQATGQITGHRSQVRPQITQKKQ